MDYFSRYGMCQIIWHHCYFKMIKLICLNEVSSHLCFSCSQAIPAALGVSATKDFHVNSLAVPRKAKDAIGGIAQLTHSDGKLAPNLLHVA